MKIGLKRPIRDVDLPENAPTESSEVNLKMMDRMWSNEQSRVAQINERRKLTNKPPVRPSLHRAILLDFLRSVWYVQPLMGVGVVAKVVQSVALGLLIETFDVNSNSRDGYVWAAVLVLCGAVIFMEHHHSFFFTWRKGMQLRIGCVASIYSKSLRLRSNGGIDAASTGKIMNLASNDVERFLRAALFISFLFWAPVESIAILIIGLQIIGPAFAAGFILLCFFFVPLQFYLSRRFASFRSTIAAITDARMTLVSQAVSGSRVMKMNGWEQQFEERISKIRKREVHQIQRANKLKAWNESIYFSSNIVISIVTFIVHVATGGELTPRNVFTTMAMINVVQLELVKFASLGVMTVSECYVSISRIQDFLEFPEIRSTEKRLATAGDCAMKLSNVNCSWTDDPVVPSSHEIGDISKTNGRQPSMDDSSSSVLALENIDLELKLGELTCIIGSVGGGKSALIQALAGELPPQTGTIERNYSKLAYASQDPWIMDGTVRENILFGAPFDESWYNKVVASCGLTVDFQQFRNRDATIVGDRGVQCSGGQRARIGLARALYRDADVLLLDDPLSAVDSKVSRLIFYSAIQDLGVKRGKCVVLATHQHQFIGEARCILMAKGRIQLLGSYNECVANSEGKILVTAHTSDDRKQQTVKHTEVGPSNQFEAKAEEVAEDIVSSSDNDHLKKSKGSKRAERETYMTYANAMGGVFVGCLLCILFTLTQGTLLVCIAAIGKWAERPPQDQNSWSILGVVIGLGVSVIVLALIRSFATFALTMKASRLLHDRMTLSVLRAQIEFFDTNPLGRIMNRFSADVGSNDDLLPQTLFDFLMTAFLVVGAIITAVTVLPFILLVIPVLLWYFLRVRSTFVATSREVKRLEAVARSPMFAMLSEALSGVAIIRSNDATDYCKKKFEAANDAHSRAFFAFIGASRWFGFRLDFLMFIFLSIATFLAVTVNDQDLFEIDSAIFGLALTMMLQLGALFQWCIRQSAEVVNQMVSVERVKEFGELPSEAPLVVKGIDDDLVDWPRDGSIDVKDLTVRYRSSLPPSLKGASFRVESGQRVGVCGRTGSGKSTLVQALFRILEAEEGTIEIGGANVATMGLHKLRTGMSVIPQVPVLFSGSTVRENLDPFHAFSIEELHAALEDVQMKEAILVDLPDGLDSVVAEGGSNFSVGQRQLLCLARAILSKSRILVLDEPTANVDSRTDELLQQSVSKSFQGATILSVAHRLDTVIDSDRILVLGNGQVLEYGSPADLLSQENGHFTSMVNDTGEKMSRDLRQRCLQKKHN
eukprot:CAMPEP_0198285332 /NCGR_PEP_ID=MMETSP1449-20131203/4662_1 /TAXON_ID=420275 /ORGANISM="Attheya septentrionalis, Strain CCMP2084" /LENGTH=1282 /DNA_ID=CAMNT_0043982737 /DNA_START=271 /DNA_END=4119 /DNA_ORIENTATION=+